MNGVYSSYLINLSSNYVKRIDIKVAGSSTGLSIEHFIDWVNNKPTNDYKVTIDTLMAYREQLYKFKEIY
ncbi:MAG: hypothetical protein E7C49_19435 [Clostridium sp.]|nr:hypothetical protein [Clostridium sp.]